MGQWSGPACVEGAPGDVVDDVADPVGGSVEVFEQSVYGLGGAARCVGVLEGTPGCRRGVVSVCVLVAAAHRGHSGLRCGCW